VEEKPVSIRKIDVAKLPRRLQWGILAAVVVGCLAAVFLLPPGAAAPLFLALVLLSIVIGVTQFRPFDAIADSFKAVPQSRQRLLLFIAEISLILLVAVAVNWNFIRADSHERIAGYEFEWLTSSAYFAHESLTRYGYIPLWQPFNEFGEPLIDNPFSLVLNPLSTAPTLIWGGVTGFRISAVLYGMFAGLGGYFLARVLRLGFAPRLLLAILMIAKGNMLAMIGTGYFQLGTSQAYFPWIIGAGIATLRQAGQRWHIVLLAVMFTLLFWAGNIWYTLPMLFSLVLLTLMHALPERSGRWQWAGARRMVLAGVLTLGLSAISFLPITMNSSYIARHTPEVDAGVVTDPLRVATFFVGAEREYFDLKIDPYYPQFYYSFVVPFWFLVLLFVVLPPVGKFRVFNRAGLEQTWRIWLLGIIVLLGTFIWGVGGNPLMIFLYDTFPLLARWRFVGRALAVTSFWLLLLVALRFDSLWRLVLDNEWLRGKLPATTTRLAQINIALLIFVLAAGAVFQVGQSASFYAHTIPVDAHNGVCLTWLRQQYPERELAVWRFGYEVTSAFLDNRIRQVGIEADFAAVPQGWSLGQIDLTLSPPEFAIGWYDLDGEYLMLEGYEAVVDSPRSLGNSCLWRDVHTLPYAYSITLVDIQTATGGELDRLLTTPVSYLQRLPDRMRMYVQGNAFQSLVVTAQERAYPGWQVWVDGQPVRLESVGGQVGVVLPPSLVEHEIVFAYRPPLFFIGGAITLLTWAFCIAYLLRLDHRLWRRK
jgi:hypothetical protein